MADEFSALRVGTHMHGSELHYDCVLCGTRGRMLLVLRMCSMAAMARSGMRRERQCRSRLCGE